MSRAISARSRDAARQIVPQPTTSDVAGRTARWALCVRGAVQGVGFRPFVHKLATELGLSGYVRNNGGSVHIQVQGAEQKLARFHDRLWRDAPRLAHVTHVTRRALKPTNNGPFQIKSSRKMSGNDIRVSPDVATCAMCLAETWDPVDRRYRYPFSNCTQCGPRLTIIQGTPYDRDRTTMAEFIMCAACRGEYENSADRRFHAQPIACSACGPRLRLHGADGRPIDSDDPLGSFAAFLRSGQIGAIKGLGGFHLVCDARSQSTVLELRRRKHRDEKPFAMMLRDVDAARAICYVGDEEYSLLTSRRAPIVLLRKRDDTTIRDAAIAPAIAPGIPYLGVLLPYTPLHHLLLHAMADAPLVMTSGNKSDEPIAYQNGDALERLSDVADCVLLHNRPIQVRCEDSVARIVNGIELPVRRSRGYAPEPISVPTACAKPMLAVGGQLKNTFAFGRQYEAILSHHLGDLDDWRAYRAFEHDIRLYEQFFETHPRVIVHDLHPDYASTHYARRRARSEGIDLLAVQHHHAHMASCMAEHGLREPVIGVCFDGTGYGTDGQIWGGEFLVGDYAHVCRRAHFRYVRLPGGDRAVHMPWRTGMAHMLDAGRCDGWTPISASPAERQVVTRMIERGFNSPWTSSVGRLFDAVAAIVGLREVVSYEGQAAVELEGLAAEAAENGSYPYEFISVEDASSRVDMYASMNLGLSPADGPASGTTIIDTRPMIRAVLRDVNRQIPSRKIARQFHSTLVRIISKTCERIRAQTGESTVVLSGGVFLNALLTSETVMRLTDAGFQVFRHQRVPPNDGGLCLGQLAIAAAWLEHNSGRSATVCHTAEKKLTEQQPSAVEA